MKNITNHKRATAMNEESMLKGYQGEIIASRHVALEGRCFGYVSTEDRMMKLFFFSETSTIAVM